jgi:glycosyltransferase involved in cell wall biosynthesis
MKRSVVIETFNLSDPMVATLSALLKTLDLSLDDELIVTHVNLSPEERARVKAETNATVRFAQVPSSAGYYDHKNQGFTASSGDIVAFIDGDCVPTRGWLAALTAPLQSGESAVASGFTSYPGSLARIANPLDFPYFRTRTGGVRNFFANNVAFTRKLFARHMYPRLESMYHGQCQVLGLALQQAGVSIAFVKEARVEHAWPADPYEWFKVRLLRGADARQLLPFVAGSYIPRSDRLLRRMGPIPALALMGARAIVGTANAVCGPNALAGVAMVAVVTGVDSAGALFRDQVYERFLSH